MEPLNLTLTASNVVDLSVSSLRGLWFKQDFFSDHCQTFYAPSMYRTITVASRKFYAPVDEQFESLKESAADEISTRREMTEKHLEKMRADRDVWEEKMEKILLEEEKKSKGSKKRPGAAIQPKTSAKVNAEIEPPVVDESSYVDVETEYCAFEMEKFNEERKIFLPENLGLAKNEVRKEILCFTRSSGTFVLIMKSAKYFLSRLT